MKSYPFLLLVVTYIVFLFFPLKAASHCGPNNGGCAHLCLPDPQDEGDITFSCVCADGYLSLKNGRQCVRQGSHGKYIINLFIIKADLQKCQIRFC